MWALVPVKPFDAAKSRLARALTAHQRSELARHMLDDVLSTLAQVDRLDGIAVTTSDAEVSEVARRHGARVLPEISEPDLDNAPRTGEQRLNASLSAALRQLEQLGATGVLIVPADLPLIDAVEVERVLDSCEAPAPVVALVTDRHGEGTNTLACRPPSLLEPAFGKKSAEHHRRAARQAGARLEEPSAPTLALDIDTPEDLSEVLRRTAGCAPSASSAWIVRTAGSERAAARTRNRRRASPARAEWSRALAEGRPLSAPEALALAECAPLEPLLEAASELRDRGHGNLVSYSRKVFLPLTHLCRDICHYCIFARPPEPGEAAYLTPEQVLAQARAAAEAGCKEALFTLGDKPEERWSAARDDLAALGHETTLSYLKEVAQLVLDETGLLPHLNPGLLGAEDFTALRPVSASMGIMLESTSERLLEKGQAHYGCPDKVPARRLETLRLAGEARVPFTSGILIGIGETRRERVEALLALRETHQRDGHLQEVIVQNFRAKQGTRMAEAAEPDLDDLLWTIAVARLVLGPEMNVQAPPNLSPGMLPRLVAAGINDWGGVSPLTPDFVNPEAPWPHLDQLERETAAAGKVLTERLTLYPKFALEPERWLDPALRAPVLRSMDAEGFARATDWAPGEAKEPPARDLAKLFSPEVWTSSSGLRSTLDRLQQGMRADESELTSLFASRGSDAASVCSAANELRREVNGDRVRYVVNRNINYTNICYFKCRFCAFSKGKTSEQLRGKPYDIGLEEIERRVIEAWERGATEVCMQGGIHPDYTGQTYVDIVRAVKRAVPEMHVHAFSPLEVWQGAATLGVPLDEFLERLREAGLGTLPGTAAEVLDDEVRRVLCSDKIRTDQWLEVMRTAHRIGLRSTATIMYGHIDHPRHWARHLLRVRDLQEESLDSGSGGFTEFVPLPFVPMEAPIYLEGRARRGPTVREAVLMHAVARLALHPLVPNIQASWVKLGPAGVAACLDAGANDLGGTLMNESITRAAGASWGEELAPSEMETLIRRCRREPEQRTTLYGPVEETRKKSSFAAAPLTPPVLTAPAARQGPAPELSRPGLD